VAGLVDECLRDPQGSRVGDLLTVVNLGLLERLARDVAARPLPIDAPLVELDAWDDAQIAALLADPKVALDLDRPLALAPGVELARPVAPGLADPPLWIVVRDEVRYTLGGEDTLAWREVLRRLDGERPLRAVLAEAGVGLEAVRKHVEEALEFEVVAYVARGRASNGPSGR
jgi:hypothetical protein